MILYISEVLVSKRALYAIAHLSLALQNLKALTTQVVAAVVDTNPAIDLSLISQSILE